jgi:hypothetical protein
MQTGIRKTTIDPAYNQVWWGYYSDASLESVIEFGIGTDANIDGAIFIPGSNAGKVLKAIRFFCLTKTHWKDVSVWVSTTLPDSAAAADIEYDTVSVSDISAMMETLDFTPNDIALKNPYTITEDGVYIGYSFTVEGGTTYYDKYPIFFVDGTMTTGSGWLQFLGEGWDDFSVKGIGCQPIKGLLEGDYPINSATPTVFDLGVVTKDSTHYYVPITIKSEGTAAIDSIYYSFTTNGVESREKNLVLPEPIANMGDSAIVNIPVTPDEETKTYTKTFTIKRVNGVTNESPNPSITGKVITLASAPKRKAAYEEMTGTWCGFCPRGYTAVELLRKNYSDDVVCMSVHGDGASHLTDPRDSMMVESNLFLINYTNENHYGYPSAYINRDGIHYDPYWGSGSLGFYVYNDILEQQERPAVASLDVTAKFLTDSTIEATTNTTFGYNSSEDAYALSYVLIEDSLFNENWLQANYYGYYYKQNGQDYTYGDSLLQYWNTCNTVNDLYCLLPFYNVSILNVGGFEGVDQSVSLPLVVNEQQKHTQILNLNEVPDRLIQNRDKMRVAVLLIDRASGCICNAAETKVNDDLTAITSPAVDKPAVEAIYNIAGQRMNGMSKGINIIKKADGTTIKVLKK